MLKPDLNAYTIEFEATRFADGSAKVRARLRSTDGKHHTITSSFLDKLTLEALIALLEGARGSVHIPASADTSATMHGLVDPAADTSA